jgi:hypothetical protein
MVAAGLLGADDWGALGMTIVGLAGGGLIGTVGGFAGGVALGAGLPAALTTDAE